MSFEEKKQEIIENIILAVGIGVMVESEVRDLHLYLEKLEELQPDVKTCASCEHFSQDLSNTGTCKKGIGCDFINYVDGITQIVYIDFGCIHHKERVDDEKL